MPDPQWIEDARALVADCRPDGTPKASAGSMSIQQNAALLKTLAHIAELRGLFANELRGRINIGDECFWCRSMTLLDRQEPPTIDEENKPLAPAKSDG